MRALLLLPPALLVAVALGTPRPARAQEAAREVHLGAGSCAAQACHGGGFPERMEYKVWATEDRHSKAFESLAGELGRRMGRRLGIEPMEAPECLSCHGTTGVELARTFDPSDGVSCEICHGGAGGWLGPHATPAWKETSALRKEELGLRDLSTPEKRVRACVSCHVGGEGRELPHRLMAAGHPPLAFDAAKFLRDMPPHWVEDDPRPVATWVLGLRAAAAAALRGVERAAADRDRWPEFAVFDCYACHHAIQAGSVYEKVDPPGRPGDLPLDLSPLKVLLVAAGDRATLERFGGILSATFPPGGDARAFGKQAGKMAAEVETLFGDADRYGESEAKRFLENLDAHLAAIESGTARAPKHEMQQIAFAIESLGGRADAALAEALAPAAPYDAALCARLARAAIAR
jgi:hypothetical protein